MVLCVANVDAVRACIKDDTSPDLCVMHQRSSVRCATATLFGSIIAHIECKVREARDKARLTLKMIVKDLLELSPILATSLVSTFAVIAPTCPQNYIEDIIATHLSTIASFALQQSRNIELVNALVEAYSLLVYCPLSSQCPSGVVLPELRYLKTLVNQCLPQQEDAVRFLLREAESRQYLLNEANR